MVNVGKYTSPMDPMGNVSLVVFPKRLLCFLGLDSTAVGDEGGFAPAVADPEEVDKFLHDRSPPVGHPKRVVIVRGIPPKWPNNSGLGN